MLSAFLFARGQCDALCAEKMGEVWQMGLYFTIGLCAAMTAAILWERWTQRRSGNA